MSCIRVSLLFLMLSLLLCAGGEYIHAADSSEEKSLQGQGEAGHTSGKQKKSKRVKAEGEISRKIAGYSKGKSFGGYSRWKMKLPFWPRKLIILLELVFYISIGVLLGQTLEVAGVVRYISFITIPLLKLGGLPKSAGPPLIMAFQSGAVANSMLASCRDEGQISNRQLYTSVLVVSGLSLFAHLPTYITPLWMAFGAEAAGIFFGVRFAAIIGEIVCVLVVSNIIVKRYRGDVMQEVPEDERLTYYHEHDEKKRGAFWVTVWRRSRRTLKRLMIYVIPSFGIMAMLEYYEIFDWLSEKLPGLFSYSFLPSQASAIIPAQAVSLYNGAIAAGNFVDEGVITSYQAILILLCGSLITSPFRTLKHALPTYIAVLGPRAGMVLAIAAQLLRCLFVGTAIALLIIFL